MDIFESLNFVNPALQGKETNFIHCQEKLSAFNMKLTFWHSKLQNKNFAPFPHLNAFLDENELDVKEEKRCSRGHETPHSIIGEEIRHYFPDLEDFQKYCRFVKNPFGMSVLEICLHKIIYIPNVVNPVLLQLYFMLCALFIIVSFCVVP